MAFTQEKFESMMAQIDKDGDGKVEKSEFKDVWFAMNKGSEPAKTDADYDLIWTQIDADGDGNLTVDELAAFFGFGESGSNEMTDEQILEALQMQATLDELDREKGKKREEAVKKEVKKDDSVKTVMLEEKKKKKDPSPEEALMVEFLELLEMGDLKFGDETKTSVTTMLHSLDEAEENKKPRPFSVRCMDQKKELALHKLARIKIADPKIEDDKGCKEQTFISVFTFVIKHMRAECKAINKPECKLYNDVNHQDAQGKTALFIALEKKNSLMVDQLFKLGKDGPDALLANSVGWTCMHVAVFTDDLGVVKQLVQNITAGRTRALLRSFDKSGRQPLHIAAYKCTEEMVQYLVEPPPAGLGAPAEAKDSGGNDAEKLAGRSGRRASKEMIANAKSRNSKEDPEAGGTSARSRRNSRESREASRKASKEIEEEVPAPP